MTESTMVDRVARAMHNAVNATGKPWEYVKGDGYCEAQISAARAAIEAMREPTKEMIEAGQVEYAGESFGEDCNLCLSTYVAEMAWQAMIDAALDEKA